MAAFDQSLTPVAATPAVTTDVTLFTATTDTSVLIDATNIGAGAIAIRIGVTPSGGANSWRLFDVPVPIGDAILRYGPVFLQNGDAVIVRTDTANDAVFSLDGVETSV